MCPLKSIQLSQEIKSLRDYLVTHKIFYKDLREGRDEPGGA